MASLDSTKADAMRQFLIDNRLSLAEFDGDKAVQARLRPQFSQSQRDLKADTSHQLALYGDNPAVKEQFMRKAEALRRGQRDMLQRESLLETMENAGRNPNAFKDGLASSREADQTLGRQPYDTGGLVSGAVSGGVLGNSVGKMGARAHKVNPRFFGPVGAVAGTIAGSAVGTGIGRKLNEHVSGRSYGEVKAPFEIARGLKDDGQ